MAEDSFLDDELTDAPMGPREFLPETPPALATGYKSSEFWLHIAAQVLAAVVALGLLSSEKADGIFKAVGAAVTAVFSVLGAVFYAQNRTALKRGQ